MGYTTYTIKLVTAGGREIIDTIAASDYFEAATKANRKYPRCLITANQAGEKVRSRKTESDRVVFK
jgi:hypothetical protein